mmetsp:Transcript_107857/g.337716  ORF Transcript_107857/g.337716 Transcript_107857/m.337716 type:complete len:220 (-) Transcript_107857:100-759(-)
MVAVSRRTRAAGHAALALAAAAWVLGTRAFISTGVPTSSKLRGSATVFEQYTPFNSGLQVAEAVPSQRAGAGFVASLAAALGLLAAVSTSPVRAAEAAAPAAEAAPAAVAEPAAAPAPAPEPEIDPTPRQKKRGSRPKAAKKVAAKEVAAKEEGGFTLPSFSVPESAPEKKKVIISPADEIDDDEKPLGASNWPLAALLLFGPSAIYTVFWVLGSLDVI